MVTILNWGVSFEFSFLRYSRFVISVTLGMAGISWLHPIKSGVLYEALDVYLYIKSRSNPACFHWDIANMLDPTHLKLGSLWLICTQKIRKVLAMCKGNLSAIITRLMSKCEAVASGRKFLIK